MGEREGRRHAARERREGREEIEARQGSNSQNEAQVCRVTWNSATQAARAPTERTWDRWQGEARERRRGEGEKATLTTAPAIIVATPTI
jgi:hypothetical protein